MNLVPMAMILAAKLSTETLLVAGALGGAFIVMMSFSNWRLAVKAALVVLLFEGALRKWILPSGQELIYFLKDGILLGAYIRFFLFPDPEIRAFRVRGPTFLIWILCLLVCFSAFNPNINSIIIAAYGVKIYFYYVPLAFMMPYLFKSEEDFMRQLRWYALLATPICLIGILQFAMPGSSIWNVYAQTGADTSVNNFGWGGAGEKVRITGTFSYLTGHTTFCVFFNAIHLALLVNKQPRFWQLILTANLAMLFANGLMGGSRSCVAVMGMTLAFFAVKAFGRKMGTSQNPAVVIFTAIAGTLTAGAYYFYTAWLYWVTRASVASDSVRSRLIGHTKYALSHAVNDGGFFGVGIGSAHPATGQLRRVLHLDEPLVATPTYDHEMGQVLVELGLVGFTAWYGLRIMTTYNMWRTTDRVRPGIIRSLVVGVSLLSLFHLYFLQVVYNHTAAMLLWASYGVSLMPTLHPIVTMNARRARAPRERAAAGPPVPRTARR